MDSNALTPDYVPAEWSAPDPSPTTGCTCTVPLPDVRAARKGAARTHCARCGLPIRIAFEPR
jgi:hypothetical protein